MIRLKIGGVPEHFNEPWKMGINSGVFAVKNIELEWLDYVGGTGDIITALRNKQIDIAVVLTEGITKDILKGNQAQIIATYVDSPLVWGIHTGLKNKNTDLNTYNTFNFAISRYGSGSHLMAYALVKQLEKPYNNITFTEVKNISGALKALENSENLLFLWEKYMTKPFVDAGQITHLGDIPTPWSSFVVVARNEIIQQFAPKLDTILYEVRKICAGIKENPTDFLQFISDKYEIQLNDCTEWLNRTTWKLDSSESFNYLKKTVEFLQESGNITPEDCIDWENKLVFRNEV